MMTAMVNGVVRTERDLCLDVVREAFARHGALDVLPFIPTETLAYFILAEHMSGEQVYTACCRTHAES
jgi:hypothetical protein